MSEQTQERMGRFRKRRLSGACTVALMIGALALGACRESEQDRVLQYEPGTYLGPEDEALSPETVDELRDRARTGMM